MSQYQHIASATVAHAYALRCLLNMIDDQYVVITWGSREVKLCHAVREGDSTSLLNIIIATAGSYHAPVTPVSVKLSRVDIIKHISATKANKGCTLYLVQDVILQYGIQVIVQDYHSPATTFIVGEAALPSHVVLRRVENIGHIPSKQLVGMAELCKVQNARLEVNVMTDAAWQFPAVQLSVYHEVTQVSSLVVRPPGMGYALAPSSVYPGLCLSKLSHLKSSFKNDIAVLLVYNQPIQDIDLSAVPDLNHHQYRIHDAKQLSSNNSMYHVVFQGGVDHMLFQLILI